jgi:hypothetical protein
VIDSSLVSYPSFNLRVVLSSIFAEIFGYSPWMCIVLDSLTGLPLKNTSFTSQCNLNEAELRRGAISLVAD